MTQKYISKTAYEVITSTARRAKNKPITIMGVSKRQSVTNIILANKAGINNFGENYLSEAKIKIPECCECGVKATWHYIGRIQSKDCKEIAAYFDWVHTLDRPKVALKLNAHATRINKKLKVCLQVNISEDNNKNGISPSLDDLSAFAHYIETLPSLELRGIMVLPNAEDKSAFKRTNKLLKLLNKKIGNNLDTLSMGMSQDFLKAIDAGATIVRIGSLLFGARAPSDNKENSL